MISLQNISLTYHGKPIFAQISWLIGEKSRVGLVGDNGVGKTTLFRAIQGDVSLDGGAIEIAKNKRIGYLPQDLVELEALPVMEYLKQRDIETGINYVPNHLQPFYRSSGENLPRTEAAYGEILTLPLHCALSDADVSMVIDTVRSFFTARAQADQ